MHTDYDLVENDDKVTPAKVDGQELMENKLNDLAKRAHIELIKIAMFNTKKHVVEHENLSDNFVAKIL